MIKQVSKEEIKEAIFSMKQESFPRPDGFTILFFQVGWDIIQHDFVKDILHFFKTNIMLNGINHTRRALIPKNDLP